MSDLPTWLVALVATIIPGFGTTPEQFFNGYVEADTVIDLARPEKFFGIFHHGEYFWNRT